MPPSFWGVLLGGQLVGQTVSTFLLRLTFPFVDTGIDTPPEAAISVLIFVYLVAAPFNTRIPETGVPMPFAQTRIVTPA